MPPTSTGTSPATSVAKPVARVALVDVQESMAGILRDCFRQFGIQTVPVAADTAAQRLMKEKFDACVLRLDENAAALLQLIRTSPSNRRILIYGIAAATQEALRLSQYGINAVLEENLDRQSALKVVRGTYLLVVHELRRYVRVPIVAQVLIETAARRKLLATSLEISAGGMSLSTPAKLASGEPVEVRFDLPGASGVAVRANTCWARTDGQIGVRFTAEDNRRFRVKKWIEDYLDIL